MGGGPALPRCKKGSAHKGVPHPPAPAPIKEVVVAAAVAAASAPAAAAAAAAFVGPAQPVHQAYLWGGCRFGGERERGVGESGRGMGMVGGMAWKRQPWVPHAASRGVLLAAPPPGHPDTHPAPARLPAPTRQCVGQGLGVARGTAGRNTKEDHEGKAHKPLLKMLGHGLPPP